MNWPYAVFDVDARAGECVFDRGIERWTSHRSREWSAAPPRDHGHRAPVPACACRSACGRAGASDVGVESDREKRQRAQPLHATTAIRARDLESDITREHAIECRKASRLKLSQSPSARRRTHCRAATISEQSDDGAATAQPHDALTLDLVGHVQNALGSATGTLRYRRPRSIVYPSVIAAEIRSRRVSHGSLRGPPCTGTVPLLSRGVGPRFLGNGA